MAQITQHSLLVHEQIDKTILQIIRNMTRGNENKFQKMNEGTTLKDLIKLS